MEEDSESYFLAQENNKRGLTKPPPHVIIKKKQKGNEKMDTMILLEMMAGFTAWGIAEVAERLFDLDNEEEE